MHKIPVFSKKFQLKRKMASNNTQRIKNGAADTLSSRGIIQLYPKENSSIKFTTTQHVHRSKSYTAGDINKPEVETNRKLSPPHPSNVNSSRAKSDIHVNNTEIVTKRKFPNSSFSKAADMASVASFPQARNRLRKQKMTLTYREFDLGLLASTTDSSCYSDFEVCLDVNYSNIQNLCRS